MKTISIIGNITNDCEIRKTNDKSVINFTVAVNEKFLDKQGNKVNNAMFFDCSYWRKDGSSLKVADFLKKGVQVFVSGSPDINLYINKQGQAAGNLRITVDALELLSTIKKDGEELNDSLNQEK